MIPNEDYVLRIHEPALSLDALRVNVLDITTAPGDEPVALLDWELGSGGTISQAGFSVMRFTTAGALKWQMTNVFCGPAGPGDSCGRWLLTNGAITTADANTYIAVGTLVNADSPSDVRMIAMGIADGGKLLWLHEYAATAGLARAVGIVPLGMPDQFLIAARSFSESDTWLFGIDRNGVRTGLTMRFENRFVQRLRSLPTQEIFVVGSKLEEGKPPLGWILNLDLSASVKWERTYDPGMDRPLRWSDIAEANTTLTVIGNLTMGNQEVGPFVVSLQNNSGMSPGSVNQASRPQEGGTLIRLHGIANIQTSPSDPSDISITSICGDFNGAPWHIAIDDSFTFFWQKKYGKTASGSLTPILIPNRNAIITGGFATAPAKPTEGLLVQSEFSAGGTFMCGTETNADFEVVDLADGTITTSVTMLLMSTGPWFINQAPLLEVTLDCPA